VVSNVADIKTEFFPGLWQAVEATSKEEFQDYMMQKEITGP